MIRLARITLREIRLPLVEPFRTSSGTVDVRRVLLLALADASGEEVWSECVAQERPDYSPDTVDTCWLAIQDWLAPRVLGHAIAEPGDAQALLGAGVRGHHMARAAIEMGIWATAAVLDGVPLAVRLHGASALTGGDAPRRRVFTGIAIGRQGSAAASGERARAAASEGYQRIKLKIGPEDAVATVAAARAAVGPAVQLSADANSSFTLDDPAHVATLEALDAFGLTMIEQPLAADDLRRHAVLQQRLTTPICLDESITGIESAEDMLALGSGRVVNLKPGRVGGFAEAVAIHDLCARSGVALWCGGMLETGIGRAYNIALASLSGFTMPGDLSPSARYWTRDVVTPPWTMSAHGEVAVPLDRPGLGVEIDADFIDDCTVRSVTMDAE